jgi:hypothetical protein
VNGALKRIFLPKWEEVAGGWRRLHNEFYNLGALPDFIWVIKSRRMRLAGHVGCMGTMRNACNILVGKLKGRNHLEVLGVDGKIILEWLLGK